MFNHGNLATRKTLKNSNLLRVPITCFGSEIKIGEWGKRAFMCIAFKIHL